MEMDKPNEIRRRSLSGIKWTTAQTVVIGLLGPLSQIVRARFLSADELGAVAVLMIIYGIVQTIENAGLGQAMVQKSSISEEERFTFLIFALVFGMIGSLLLFFTGSYVEKAFGVPGSAHLIRIGGPLLFFAVIDQYIRALFYRELLFRGPAIIETLKKVVNIILMLILFIGGFGAQSVVLALLISTVIGVFILGILAIKRKIIKLKPVWAKSAIRQLINLGAPIAGKQLFTYFTHSADEIVIAIALPPATLGVYHLAKETLQKLQILITGSFSRVLLSLFSRIGKDNAKLSRVYARITLVISYIGIPVFVGVALTAHDIVPAVFGQNWIEAVPAFRVLSFALIPIVLTANISTSLMYAMNKAGTVLIIDIAVNTPYLVVLFFLQGQGLMPVLLAYLVYCFIKTVVLQTASNLQLSLGPGEHLAIYGRVVLRVVVMAILVIITSILVHPVDNIFIRAGVSIFVGVVGMVSAVYLTDKPAIHELLSVIKRS